PNAIADWRNLQSWDGYRQTLAGDGVVPHSLGLIEGLQTYFVQAEHNMLAADGRVIQAVEDLLTVGRTNTLPTQMPAIGVGTQMMLLAERTTEAVTREARAHLLREIVRLEHQAHPDKISVSEIELQDLLLTRASPKARSARAVRGTQ